MKQNGLLYFLAISLILGAQSSKAQPLVIVVAERIVNNLEFAIEYLAKQIIKKEDRQKETVLNLKDTEAQIVKLKTSKGVTDLEKKQINLEGQLKVGAVDTLRNSPVDYRALNKLLNTLHSNEKLKINQKEIEQLKRKADTVAQPTLQDIHTIGKTISGATQKQQSNMSPIKKQIFELQQQIQAKLFEPATQKELFILKKESSKLHAGIERHINKLSIKDVATIKKMKEAVKQLEQFMRYLQNPEAISKITAAGLF